MLQRVPQGSAGELNDTLERFAQLENEEDGRGDGARPDEQDREGGDVERREQAETDEDQCEPEHQDQEERERELVLLLLDQQPAGLNEVAQHALRLGEGLAMGLVW